jgi:hypothetical protein
MSQDIVRAPCSNCMTKTDHLILISKTVSDSEPYDEEYNVYWQDIYQLLECCGCHCIVLHKVSTFSAYYPPGATRRPPSWISRLPGKTRAMLGEVYIALDNNCLQLAMMGIRALLDQYLVDAVGDVGGFDKKLDCIVSEGLLGSQQKAFLETVLDAGHAVMHRSMVDEVMDVLESFLHSYVAQESLEDLRSAIPDRKTSKKESKLTMCINFDSAEEIKSWP